MPLEDQQSCSLNVPEEHADSVRSLLRVLESRAWVADFITDILDHYQIYGISTCTPDYVAEQLAGPALFLRAAGGPADPGAGKDEGVRRGGRVIETL